MTINEISVEGVCFINDLGQKSFISFFECNENWLAYRKRTESLSDGQVAELRGKERIVGQRNVDLAQSCIEFFTRPFTKFSFNTPEQIEEYRNLRNAITLYGWTTFDLS